MYGKPAISQTYKIYRFRWSRARVLGLLLCLFFVGFSGLVTYIYWLNIRITGQSPEIYIIGIVGCITIGYVWLVSQTYFRPRLKIASDISEFRGIGHKILFKWEDVEEVAYVYSRFSNYQLSLILDQPYRISKGISFPFNDLIVSPHIIPLEMLYSANRWMTPQPSDKEAQLFYDYFMTTSLGQDILRHAPHAYSSSLHWYLADELLEQVQDDEL